MLFGLAGQFNQHRFERAAEDVWHKGLATPEEAWAYLEAIRRSGRGGVKRMADWLEKAALQAIARRRADSSSTSSPSSSAPACPSPSASTRCDCPRAR